MNSTPNANRLHIAIFGRCNSGKSSLITALTGQDTALVSAVPGTTTDLVNKAMEIHGIGPCVFLDTTGFDDAGELGEMRIARTLQAIERTDIALLLCEDGDLEEEQQWIQQLNSRHIPVILILNKSDRRECAADVAARIEKVCGKTPITVSAKEHTGIEAVYQAILRKLPTDFGQQTITGNLVQEGDLVLLVMPQDIQAPKGRLILPQVQTMRELLDKKCLVMSCTTDQLANTLEALSRAPQLIITDSQVFHEVYRLKTKKKKKTKNKKKKNNYIESAAAIGSLTPQSRILIAEACTHAPLSEDIGRVKLPRLLRKKVGESLHIDIVSGTDFPTDLSSYELIIHCGGCMFNRKYVLSRIDRARCQHIPMTNYGVAIACLNGILDKIVY